MFYLDPWVIASFGLLLAASLLDFLLGDPWNWPHPVQAIGWLIHQGQTVIWASTSSPLQRRMMGVGLGLGVIGGSGGVGGGMVGIATKLNPWLGGGMAVVLLASCLAGRSLRRAADEVLLPLECGNLPSARTCLGRYVGRDTEALTASEIYRAVFETVTENAVDGVLAPFFFICLGSCLGVGIVERSPDLNAIEAFAWYWSTPVACAFAYKAASTLDSMIGYRTEPYRDLGWFSAQFEDRLTWLPCRLAVLSIAMLSGVMGEAHPWTVLKICCRDAKLDPSPNSGWSESAYAAALGVQVGGDNYYQGVLKHKPRLGEDLRPITPERLAMAFALTRCCFLLWLAIAFIILFLIQTYF